MSTLEKAIALQSVVVEFACSNPNCLRQIADEEANTVIALDAERLFRFRLLRLSERAHWLLLTIHHVVFDGWSANVLLADLSALYNSLRGRGPLENAALDAHIDTVLPPALFTTP